MEIQRRENTPGKFPQVMVTVPATGWQRILDRESPVLYVLSKNLHRRHLTPSLRSTIAAEAVPLLQEEAKKRQGTRTDIHKQHGENGLETSPPEGGQVGAVKKERSRGAVGIAARQAGVGTVSVERALAVKKADPAAFEEARKGNITITQAHHRLNGDTSTKRKSPRQKPLDNPQGCGRIPQSRLIEMNKSHLPVMANRKPE